MLIQSTIVQLTDLRNERSFKEIYAAVTQFALAEGIDITLQPRPRRATVISSRFKNSVVDSTIRQRDVVDNEQKYRCTLYYPLIDSMLVELTARFSNRNAEILSAISALSPNSSNFLSSCAMTPLADMLKCATSLLHNEVSVLQPMMKSTKALTLIDMYFELLPLRQAFPTILSLLTAAITLPVSSTTCERTFSKLKLIKTAARNSMLNERLSDLCLLAVEREIEIDFEKLIFAFATEHKNSRVLLI